MILGVNSAAFSAEEGRRCVVVQPIIACDEGDNSPAPCRIPEDLIDQVFVAANVDVHFLEPILYNNRRVRDGNLESNAIEAQAKKDRITRLEERQVNMFFVDAIAGQPGPIGFANVPGWCSLIALGKQPSRSQDAHLIAKTLGHCLGLKDADSDENADDRTPNLIGPGDQQLSSSGLNEYQADIILPSPLVRNHVHCLALDEAKQAMLADSYETYFQQLERMEIATATGRLQNAKTLDECRKFAVEFYSNAVRSFTDREEEAIRWFVSQVEDAVGGDFPLTARHPWQFLKFSDELCGGFPHTRGQTILLSESFLEQVVEYRQPQAPPEAKAGLAAVFLHEQFHVLERMYPNRFASLFEDVFGFTRATVREHPWLEARQMSNPDALRLEWLIPMDSGQFYWPRTILRDGKPIPKMGDDFLSIAVEVQRDDDQLDVIVDRETGNPRYKRMRALTEFARQFPTRRGLEHPNELAAYLSQFLLKKRMGISTGKGFQYEKVVEFEKWCLQNLR